MFRPLLAISVAADMLHYPVMVSIKHDGIRCVMIDGVAYSRSMQKIPNPKVQELARSLFLKHGINKLDGELVGRQDGVESYRASMETIMANDGGWNFRYYVFDCFAFPEKPYRRRYDEDVLIPLGRVPQHDWFHVVPQRTVADRHELDRIYRAALSEGEEGIIARDPRATYKFGRSGVWQEMVRVKPVESAEGRIIGAT